MTTIDPQTLTKDIKDKFVVENNTLKREVKDSPKDRIQIEIGDAKQPDFKPQVKLMRWDNEVNFSMRAEEHPQAQVVTEGNLIKYVTPGYEVHQYELDAGDIGEDGGLEFEWVLPSKPTSNVLTATIQTKELDFFYQPELTQEEIAQGSSRPENVVGSYAVYHKTKGGMNRSGGMEYKTGKAFHIFRPKVKDAKGNEAWGQLNINTDTGVLIVTVDQKFLDKAVYPVVVDPTFGYTSQGASFQVIASSANDRMAAMGADTIIGTLTEVAAYLKSSAGTPNAQLHLYSNLGTVPNASLTGSSNFTITSTVTLKTSSLSYTMTELTYWAVAKGFYDGNTVSVAYDGGSAKGAYWDASWATDTRNFSVYATYTSPVDKVSKNFHLKQGFQ